MESVICCYDERADEWTLQSGFDGTELLARPNVEVITLDAQVIRQAESQNLQVASLRRSNR